MRMKPAFPMTMTIAKTMTMTTAITTTILVSALAVGSASAQNPTIIQNTRDTMNGVSSNQTSASNQALGTPSTPAPSAASVTHSAATHPAVKSTAAKSSAIAVKSQPKHSGARHAAHPKAVVAVSQTVGVQGSVQAPSPAPVAASSTGNPASSEGENYETEQSVVPDSRYAANGRRDPFISPVVSHAGGSGCSTGKKCLEIGAINLRGVVHSDAGFIAVVSNGLNKAYFLRENDPVFNGYVVKITGDSIVFQETLQDRLGKTFTREVVKKITTPAV
jgi:Tfp pilus assembly protein PilP